MSETKPETTGETPATIAVNEADIAFPETEPAPGVATPAHTTPEAPVSHEATEEAATETVAAETEVAPEPEPEPLPDDRAVPGLAELFLDARTPTGWTDEPVTQATLRRLYDLVKLGPTSANSTPARFVFLTTPEAKEKLRPALSEGNVAAVMAAPVVVLVAYDPHFYDHLYRLYPQTEARSWFAWNDEFAKETAIRNGTLQGAYLIAAARLIGLDAWPMSGLDLDKTDGLFLGHRTWLTNFILCLGHGIQPEGPRNPRMSFEDACEVL